MRYVRIWTTPTGDSTGEWVTPDMPNQTIRDDLPAVNLSSPLGASKLMFARLEASNPEHRSIDFHVAPDRRMAIMLEGTMEIETSDGATFTVNAGAAALFEDTTGTGHISRAPVDQLIAMVVLDG